MKTTHITKLDQLKAGTYIRAVVTFDGSCWIDIVDVFGKPYKAYGHSKMKHWFVKTNTTYMTKHYVSDFIGYGHTGVFKFSNKILNQLKPFNNTRDPIEFINVIRKLKNWNPLTDCQTMLTLCNIEHEKYLDDVFQRMHDKHYNENHDDEIS